MRQSARVFEQTLVARQHQQAPGKQETGRQIIEESILSCLPIILVPTLMPSIYSIPLVASTIVPKQIKRVYKYE